MRAMLAASKWDEKAVEEHLRQHGYLLMQPKIDGMRVLMHDKPMSRSWKPHRNKYLEACLREHAGLLRGMDGEIVPGLEYGPSSFRQAMSGIRAEEGSPEFTFFVFDLFTPEWSERSYLARMAKLESLFIPGEDSIIELNSNPTGNSPYYTCVLRLTPTRRVSTLDEIYSYEQELLAEGHEGGILRTPNSPYKYNRATNREGYLMKLKRFEDAEAIVVGYEPWYENQNEATLDPRGYTARSSHQENLKPLPRLGALLCRLRDNPSVEFKVGVFLGVDHSERDRLWENRESLIGRMFTFKHQGFGGGYDKPRTPVFLNWRSATEF